MDKLGYLEALKRAMLGLPPELQARTLAWYEQRFVDGMAAGRAESEVARELDDPTKVALTLRTSTHMHAFTQRRNPADLVRLCVSALGLLIFNLFMAIPAAVFGSLLAALYAAAFAFYVGGIAIAAAGLAGANELVLDGPLARVAGGQARDAVRTRIAIGGAGIEVSQERASDAQAEPQAPTGAGARVMRGAGRMAGSGIRISTAVDTDSRATQAALGLSMVLGGIVLFLVSVVATRHAALGVKRYLEMNLSLLRGR